MLRTLPACHLLLSFFFNDTATTEIYTLSLHDALPISAGSRVDYYSTFGTSLNPRVAFIVRPRSEEHTSELQSLTNLVCRLLLEKKKTNEYRTCCAYTNNTPSAKTA